MAFFTKRLVSENPRFADNCLFTYYLCILNVATYHYNYKYTISSLLYISENIHMLVRLCTIAIIRRPSATWVPFTRPWTIWFRGRGELQWCDYHIKLFVRITTMIFEAKPFEEYQKILVEQADYIEDWYHTFCFVISPLCRTVWCESKKPTPFGKATRDVRFPANTSRTGQSFPYISCARLIFEIAINISISASYSFLFHPKIFKTADTLCL